MTTKAWVALLGGIYLFRTAFGLCESHWDDRLEQVQHYLVGLKYHTTGLWPYFGVDMFASESSRHSQLPGALFGLLIGSPFHLWPHAEAPFLLVNLLSLAGVALLAWYLHRRLPDLSLPWLLLWIAVAPWSLHFSTHIFNLCYLLLPSVLFFVGFMESLPALSLRSVPVALANSMMGFGVLFMAQFHFSVILLLPFAAYSLLVQAWKGRDPRPVAFFLAGASLPAAFLVPTFLEYGFGERTSSGAVYLSGVNWGNVMAFPTLLARYLSLVCSELPRFLGPHTKERLDFLAANPVIAGPGVVLWIVGLVQPFILLWAFFDRRVQAPHWREVKFLTLAALALVWGSFWFTVKKPLSHQYLILFPLLMTYSCHVWASFAGQRVWALAAKVFIVLSIVFQAGYALAVHPKRSVLLERGRIEEAIQQKDHRILAERRPGSYY